MTLQPVASIAKQALPRSQAVGSRRPLTTARVGRDVVENYIRVSAYWAEIVDMLDRCSVSNRVNQVYNQVNLQV